MTKLILTDADKASYLWMRLTKNWNERLDQLRNQLEGSKTEIETADLRGRIKELRAILLLNESPAATD